MTTVQNVKTQAQKRIHSVTIKRMVDDSPDTSWLGEYANSPTSEYSIDRKHSLDCPINTGNHTRDDYSETHAFALDSQDFCSQCDMTHEQGKLAICPDYDITEDCDCGERGDMGRHEYRYFNPSDNYKGETPENTRKYVRQDYERMESLNRGDWCFIGIRADAEVDLPGGRLARISQQITSGGLWGIESDSDQSYIESVEQEELSSLRSQLEAIGFSKRAISAAFRNVEHKEE